MPITVNTNMSSLICQRSLSKATNGMNTALQRMSTGLRINSSKDDAAGMAISSKMNTKLSSYSVAQDNVQMGSSMLDTASGSIDTMTSMLQRMRDLSEQAANGTYGAEERKAMQAEVDALTKEIYRIKNTTEFNGKKILGEEIYKTGDVPPKPVKTATISMGGITDLSKVNKSEIIGISNADELAKLATFTNNGSNVTAGRTFVLTGDIDLSSKPNWTTIGKSVSGDVTFDKTFKGSFDGNGYAIKNLTINEPTKDYQGLFGYAYGAKIENVNLTNANVTGANYTGGLVGYNTNKSTITNCSISGTVEVKSSRGGGLVGYNDNSTITNCSATGTVNGYFYIGGLVGLNSSSTISNCSAQGTVTGKSNNTGGLVGYSTMNSTIKNCSAVETVKGASYTGGLVGANYENSTIDNCSAEGTITGTGNYTGGLVALNQIGSTISNCSVTGTVSGKIYTGGFVGFNANKDGGDYTTKSTIKNCYSSCSITSTESYTGGFIGRNRESDILNCSYDKTKSKRGNYIGYPLEGSNSKIDPFKDSTTNPFKNNTNSPQPIFLTNLQVGLNNDENSVLAIDTGFEIGGLKISLKTEADALNSIKTIDALMGKLTDKSLNLGATQNRLSSIKDFQRVQMSALTSASSLIKDADIAKESASYIKSQILQQTTATLLATANQNPSIALSLV